MTPDHDIERVLDRWLTEGPTQMPERFLDATLDRIDGGPAGRLTGLPARVRATRTDPRLAVAAVVMVAVAAAAIFIAYRGPGVGESPSPTPSAAPSVSAAAAVDLATLIAKWTSVGSRAYPEVQGSVFADIRFGAASLSINAFKGSVESRWSVDVPDGPITLEMLTSQTDLTREHWDCRPGQAGHYGVGLSPAGSTLTLTPLDDACAARAAILGGDWERWPCPNPDSTCERELTPGRHGWEFGPNIYLIGYSADVPAGWSHLPSGDTLGRPNDPGSMAINLLLDVAPASQASDCPDAVEPGVGNGAGALADWLTTLPGLVSSPPAPITIGGRDGWMLDLSVDHFWELPECQYFEKPARVVFTFIDPVPDPTAGLSIRGFLEGTGQSRVILLDVGRGHNLLIEIVAPDMASWDDLVQAAMPIVESMEFTP